MMNNLPNTIDKSLILVYNVDILKEGIFVMEHIIDELLEMMMNKIEEEYSNMNSIVFYNDYKRGIELIRTRLEEFNDLQDEINQLEAENEILAEKNEELEGQMYGWQEDYWRLEKQYEKLVNNS
nr:MAG TPA: cell division protein [Caudoviricetes sp.]